MDRDKIGKMIGILAAVVVLACIFSKIMQRNSMSLTEYAKLQEAKSTDSSQAGADDLNSSSEGAETSPAPAEKETTDASLTSMSPSSSPAATAGVLSPAPSPGNGGSAVPSEEPLSAENLTGASLNADSQLKERILLKDGFYYEPLSEPLRRYITGISYPVAKGEGAEEPEITLDELRYVHILHYDFEGRSREGELICNEGIAQDLTEIFYELYRNEYQLEKVLLIDAYDGDDIASMEDNNTSCLNYRPVEGSTVLSRHALGLAIDINPLYNPYVGYTDAGEETVSPPSAEAYADRSASFPYKIDESDLCYKLFLQHGFTWGGNWNNVKDYQHFQKALD